MRYLTVSVTASDGGAFHPVGAELTADPAVERQAIHHLELLGDGTALQLAEASGSQERYREIMDGAPRVVDYLIAGEQRWVAVSQFEPTDVVRRALELQRESLLVVETPLRFTADDGLKVTYLGTDETFRELFDSVDEWESVSVEILDTGDYDADRSALSRMITPRQEEVLEAAVELGYYSEPRQASLEDVGAAIGISPGTAGEHLRKVEAQVFDEIVR